MASRGQAMAKAKVGRKAINRGATAGVRAGTPKPKMTGRAGAMARARTKR